MSCYLDNHIAQKPLLVTPGYPTCSGSSSQHPLYTFQDLQRNQMHHAPPAWESTLPPEVPSNRSFINADCHYAVLQRLLNDTMEVDFD